MAIDVGIVIETIANLTIESISENLNRNERFIRTLEQLGIEKRPTSDDFDTVYVYALIEYGTFKPKAILNFFRNEFIRESFRKSFYENDPDILAQETDGIKQWNEETRELGFIGHDIDHELDEFKEVFNRTVKLFRTPSEVEQFHKIEDLHLIVNDIQNRVRLFVGEESTAKQIARDQPEFWEHLLTIELLRPRLNVIRRELDDLKKGITFRPSRILSDVEFTNWNQAKFKDLTNLIHSLVVISKEELPRSWGYISEPGNPENIEHIIEKMVEACNAIVDWEIDLHFTYFPKHYEDIKQMMQGWAESYLDEFGRIPAELGRILSLSDPSGKHSFTLKFDLPPNAGEVITKIRMIWDSESKERK